jgi:hypothetical protein
MPNKEQNPTNNLEYLGLYSYSGMLGMFTEWRTPDGKIVRIPLGEGND